MKTVEELAFWKKQLLEMRLLSSNTTQEQSTEISETEKSMDVKIESQNDRLRFRYERNFPLRISCLGFRDWSLMHNFGFRG
jgi:hypothetical protein